MDENAAREALDGALSTYEQAFGTFFLARLLGFEISYGEGRCIIRMPVRDFLFNPQGTLHGGVIAAIMDTSMGHLLHHESGVGGATLEMKIQYLRPIRQGTVQCEAQFLRRGRSIAFIEARLKDDEGELAAVASATWKPGEAARSSGKVGS
ncbi:MAG: PaaI family thioesterase [Hyphomicrobiaceae bacterium]